MRAGHLEATAVAKGGSADVSVLRTLPCTVPWGGHVARPTGSCCQAPWTPFGHWG